MKRKLLGLLTGLGVYALASTAAQADIVVVSGVNNQGTDNVLLNPRQTL